MRQPFLPELKTMAYGFKPQDFLAFFLFPRTYREISRLERICKKQKETIDNLSNLLDDMLTNRPTEGETK